MEGAGSISEALEGGAAFSALQGLMQTWLHAAVMDQNKCAPDSNALRAKPLLKPRLPSPAALTWRHAHRSFRSVRAWRLCRQASCAALRCVICKRIC